MSHLPKKIDNHCMMNWVTYQFRVLSVFRNQEGVWCFSTVMNKFLMFCWVLAAFTVQQHSAGHIAPKKHLTV